MYQGEVEDGGRRSPVPVAEPVIFSMIRAWLSRPSSEMPAATRHNPVVQALCKRLLAAGRARKVELAACTGTLPFILNSMVKSGGHLNPPTTPP